LEKYFVETPSNLSGIRLFQYLVTLQGIMPPDVQPGWDRGYFPISEIFLKAPIEPCQWISYWGWGREGVKSPPVNIIPLLLNAQSFKKTKNR
jgi:hypothetical protein